MGLFGKKKKDKYALTKKELARFNGKPLQYAVERVDGIERVLGKNGGIIVLDDVIVVMCEAHRGVPLPDKGFNGCGAFKRQRR